MGPNGYNSGRERTKYEVGPLNTVPTYGGGRGIGVVVRVGEEGRFVRDVQYRHCDGGGVTQGRDAYILAKARKKRKC